MGENHHEHVVAQDEDTSIRAMLKSKLGKDSGGKPSLKNHWQERPESLPIPATSIITVGAFDNEGTRGPRSRKKKERTD